MNPFQNYQAVSLSNPRKQKAPSSPETHSYKFDLFPQTNFNNQSNYDGSHSNFEDKNNNFEIKNDNFENEGNYGNKHQNNRNQNKFNSDDNFKSLSQNK
jgi:hypothetical protein